MSDIAQAQVQQQSASSAEKFPDDFKKSLELLELAKLQPAKTPKEAELKAEFLKRLKAHVALIQQGLPVVQISADDEAEVYGKRFAALRRTKLELLARNNSEVKDLLNDFDSLKLEVETLKLGASDPTKALTAATLRGRAHEMKRQADELEPVAKSDKQKQVVADLRENVTQLEAEAESLSPSTPGNPTN